MLYSQLCFNCHHLQELHAWVETATLVVTEDWCCSVPGCTCINANEEEGWVNANRNGPIQD